MSSLYDVKKFNSKQQYLTVSGWYSLRIFLIRNNIW